MGDHNSCRKGRAGYSGARAKHRALSTPHPPPRPRPPHCRPPRCSHHQCVPSCAQSQPADSCVTRRQLPPPAHARVHVVAAAPASPPAAAARTLVEDLPASIRRIRLVRAGAPRRFGAGHRRASRGRPISCGRHFKSVQPVTEIKTQPLELLPCAYLAAS